MKPIMIEPANALSLGLAARAPEDVTIDLTEEGILAEKKRADEEKARQFLEKKQREKDEKERFDKAVKARTVEIKRTESIFAPRNSKPQDNSAALTQKLVAAEGQFAVRKVMGDAAASLATLRRIAATSKKDAAAANAAIKNLEKVIARGRSKIRALDQEDTTRVQKSRAEQQKLKKRAEALKDELRKKMVARKSKEMGYLLEQLNDRIFGKLAPEVPGASMPLDGASEAAISAEASAIAASESVSVGGSAGGAEAAVSSGGGEVASSGGGEAASSGDGAAE